MPIKKQQEIKKASFLGLTFVYCEALLNIAENVQPLAATCKALFHAACKFSFVAVKIES